MRCDLPSRRPYRSPTQAKRSRAPRAGRACVHSRAGARALSLALPPGGRGGPPHSQSRRSGARQRRQPDGPREQSRHATGAGGNRSSTTRQPPRRCRWTTSQPRRGYGGGAGQAGRGTAPLRRTHHATARSLMLRGAFSSGPALFSAFSLVSIVRVPPTTACPARVPRFVWVRSGCVAHVTGGGQR
jgi:hypothetical protein